MKKKKNKKQGNELQHIATEARKTLKIRVVESKKVYKRQAKHKSKPFADSREGFCFFYTKMRLTNLQNFKTL